MKVLQTRKFSSSFKRLQKSQAAVVEDAIRTVVSNPLIGEVKKGDLARIRVYKFKISKLEYLLAYEIIDKKSISLHAIAPHENFYRNLKR